MQADQPTRWQKSSFSSAGNNCVEIGKASGGRIHLRESDDPTTVVTTTPTRLHALLRLTRMRSF